MARRMLEKAHAFSEATTIGPHGYKEMCALVAAWGLDRLSAADQVTYHRGEQLEAFLSQPFYVAEPYTHRPGVSVSLDGTLNSVRRIVDGVVDDRPVEDFLYCGKLDF